MKGCRMLLLLLLLLVFLRKKGTLHVLLPQPLGCQNCLTPLTTEEVMI